MATDLEIITPHLRGSCVTIDNRIHGLFKLTSRDRATASPTWSAVRREPSDQQVASQQSQTAKR